MKTHFAIVAEPGSGHEALVELLGRNPSVRMYGELFNRSNYEVVARLADQGTLIKVGEDPIEFLETKILTDYDHNIQALGFVLRYDQARSESWSRVWSFVRKKFKVIHFKRRNHLDCYLSSLDASVYLCPSDIERIVQKSRDRQRENDIYFKHTERIDMFYEALLDIEMEDVNNSIQELCDFLALPSGFTADLLALSPPQTDRIVNYEELREHFDGKPEGEFFR